MLGAVKVPSPLRLRKPASALARKGRHRWVTKVGLLDRVLLYVYHQFWVNAIEVVLTRDGRA
jgi:hypothetical protein